MYEIGPESHPFPLKLRSKDHDDSHPVEERSVPVEVFPEPSMATTTKVFPISRVPLKLKFT